MGAGWLLGGGAGRLVAHGTPVQAGVDRHYSLTLRPVRSQSTCPRRWRIVVAGAMVEIAAVWRFGQGWSGTGGSSSIVSRALGAPAEPSGSV